MDLPRPPAASPVYRSAVRCCLIYLLILCAGAPLAARGLQVGLGDEGWVLSIAGGVATLRSGDDRIELLPGVQIEYSSLAAEGDTWIVAGTRPTATRRDELFVLAGDRFGLRELSPPQSSSPANRSSPVLVTAPTKSRDGLVIEGIAWLEGGTPRTHGIWYAAWRETGFAAPQLISPPGPGSQLALRAARLTDGSALLVWSGFDGEDDEIFWSRRIAARWTEPRRVASNNRVPDITPALIAQDEGALLAWSWYDGNHYRLVGSTFSEEAWTEPRVLAEAGSLYPELVVSRDETYLIFLNAVPRSWEIRQLTADLEVERGASVPSSQVEQPVLLSQDGRGLELEWTSDSPRGAVTRALAAWGPVPAVSPAEVR